MEPVISNLVVKDPALAGRLVRALEQATGALAHAVPSYDDDVPADLRKQIAHALGTVIGMDMHDMLMVLLRQHPQLDTHGLLDAANGGIQ